MFLVGGKSTMVQLENLCKVKQHIVFNLQLALACLWPNPIQGGCRDISTAPIVSNTPSQGRSQARKRKRGKYPPWGWAPQWNSSDLGLLCCWCSSEELASLAQDWFKFRQPLALPSPTLSQPNLCPLPTSPPAGFCWQPVCTKLLLLLGFPATALEAVQQLPAKRLL